MTAEDIVGYETMLTADPRDAELHDDVALLYLSLGKGDQAVRHFQATLDLKPSAAVAFQSRHRLDGCEATRRRGAAPIERRSAWIRTMRPRTTIWVQCSRRRGNWARRFLTSARPSSRMRPTSRPIATSRGTSPPTRRSSKELLAEAVTAAEKAAQLTQERDPNVLDALAAAYRAAGMSEAASAREARLTARDA